MDRRLTALARAARAMPGDLDLACTYTAAWRRAGEPGRDPRRDPLPGDAVLCETPSGYHEARTCGAGPWWNTAMHVALGGLVRPTERDVRAAYGRVVALWREWIEEVASQGGHAEVLVRRPTERA